MNVFVAPDGRLRSGWRLLLGLVCFIVANFLGHSLAALLTADLGERFAIAQPLICLLLLGGFWLLATAADLAPRPAEYLGLGRARAGRSFWVGAAAGAGLVALVVAVMFAAGAYAPGQPRFRIQAVALVIWTLLWGGLAEELAFRAYPFARLAEALGAGLRQRDPMTAAEAGGWGAAVLTGLLFGAGHLANPHASLVGFVNTSLIGLLFGLLMLRTWSLWLLWGFHASWNITLGLLFGLPVSGLRMFSVLHEASTPGREWLTGGPYGIEGSLVTTAVISLATIVVAWLPRRASTEGLIGIQSK